MADRNPYDDLLQQDTAQALRASMASAVDRQPDAEARLQTLARDYNMPVEAVRLRQPEIERTARLDALDYDTLARQYPKTAGTLTDPNQAAIAHDDVDNMSTLERGARQLGGGLIEAGGMAVSGFGVGLNLLQRNILGAITDMLPTPRGGAMSAGARESAIGPLVGQDFRAVGGEVKGFARNDVMIPQQRQTFADQVGAGLGQVGGQILMLPFTGPAGLYLQGLDVMDEKVQGDNASQGAKDLATLAGAVVTGVTEKWALDKLIGPVADNVKASLTGALARIGVAAASEGAQEATESLAQDLLRQQLTNPDADIQLAGALDEGSVGAAVGGIVRGIVESALHVRTRHARLEQQAQQSEAHAKVLGELLTLAEASKVRERDPAAFATFMQSLTEEGVPNVYVEAKALLQAVDINEVASVLPSVAEQINQAAATGGDVVIPTAELLTAGPGQTFMQTLVDNARTAPDAMSPVEAREYMQAKGDQLAADIQTALGQQEQDQSWRQMRDDLRDEFKAQLDGVKRFTSDVNLQYANLLANFYAVTAAKLGQTPQELATRYGLRVQSKGVEGGQVLDQGPGLDAVREQWGAAGIDSAVQESSDRITVSKIVVPEGARGQGAGTAAMRALLDYADRTGKHVVLSPSADFGGNKARLIKFYKALGFVENKGKNRAFSTSESMYRQAPGKVLQQTEVLPDTLNIDGKDRPTTNSNGQPIAQTEEGVRNFWKWFGDSKVVDDQGRPLVVYHGTTADFDTFDAARSKTTGVFFAAAPDYANIIAALDGAREGGGHVLPVYLRIEDPATVLSREFSRADTRNAKAAGRDGLLTLADDGAFSQLTVFSGEQIKSATGNSGEFDPANPSILNQFAGPNAQTADTHALATAQARITQGDDAETVRRETGWHQGVDGKWRFEISDHEAATIGEEGVRELIARRGVDVLAELTVGDVLHHPALYAAYPAIAKIGFFVAARQSEGTAAGVSLPDGANAAYSPARNEIRVSPDVGFGDRLKTVLLHEIQHGIQEIEGFAAGGSPEDSPSTYSDQVNADLRTLLEANQTLAEAFDKWAGFQTAMEIGKEFDPVAAEKAEADLQALPEGARVIDLWSTLDGLSDPASAGRVMRDRYLKLAGEVEARNTQVRATLTDEQRASAPPEQTADIPSSDVIVVFDGKEMHNAPAPANGGAARGSINLPDDLTRSPAILSLFAGADLSTFIHESGHFFLEVQLDLAARIQAEIDAGAQVTEGERSIVTDATTLLNWFGIKGSETTSPLTEWFALGLEGKRPHHEKFARGFEAYAFEGNAPSLELQSMFQKFRAWLLSVYKELKALRVELTDDVRGVMDRMLASTQAIQEAEAARRLGPLFKTAEDAGMSLDDFRAYHALATDASQAAIEELQARGLRDMKWLEGAKNRKLKELQKLHDSLRREVRAEVRREVMSQPVYRAWQFLTGKGEADETAQAPDKPKASKELDVINDDLLTAVAKLGGLNKDQAVTVWGIDPKEKPESGVFGTPVLRANGGLSIDAMAERLLEAGYLLPDEDGRHDTRDFEDKFNAALRGESIYSLWHDYKRPDDDAPVQALGPDSNLYGKLDTAELERRYGNKPDAPWRKLQKLRMTSGARGLHPDVIAETVRMESGDQMVKALLDAEPPQAVIEGMTSRRMLERFGDLGTPEGLQRAVDRAIHNEVRARFLSTEIAALERGMQVRRDTGEVNAKGQRVTVDIMAQVAKQQAERIVGGTKVKNLRPSQYTTAETRAAKAAERAMLAGNTEEALAEKRHQLINLQAARAATRAQEEVEKITSYLRRFADKPKGLDADYYDQIAQLLVRFDLAGSTTLKQIAKRKTLAAWVESQREQGFEPDIPPELLDEAGRTSYKDMTVDELRGLRDTVRQIEKLGRVKNTLLTAKQLRDFQAVRDQIADSIVANAGGRVADTRTPATRTARWFKAVKDFGAAHIKAATWARVFDGGKDGGPVWEYFIRPANEAADMETRMRAEATERLHGILAPVIKAGRMDGKGQFFAAINRSMNREQVFAMALNMGNEGNIQRMLDGEGWTVQQIEPVLATLSAADWQAVQAVWDHFESYRTLIGAKERRVYGKEPAWVDPMPLSVRTADGQTVQLRGGYYPVKYDPLANNRAEQHADAEDAKRQMQAAYTSATTRRGFTKSRAEAVKGRPLLYSLAAVYSGTQDVIHDLAFHEWLIDVNKLLRSDKINNAIRETYGPAAVRQLKTWIEDTARGEAGLQAELDSMLGRLRQGVSIAGLGFNVMSAAIQPIGLTQSVVRVGGKWIGRGVAQYLTNPLGKAREVNERSEFMASRARTRFRELNELRNQVEGEHPVRTWVSNAAFYMMTRMQMVVDVPTWLGAYEKAISEGNSDERAGQLADQAVIDAQGSGQMKDLSAIERGGPAQKLFTVFYSFMNTALNIGVAQTMTEKSKAKLVADYLLLYSVPAVLTVALKDALTPGDSGDWEDLDKILRKLLEAQLDNLFGLMVGVREVAGAAKMALGLSEYSQDYQGPAGLRLLSDIAGLGKEIGQGELDDGFRKRAINVLGSAFGLPAAQANRTFTGVQALIDGETDSPIRALAFGYQEP